MNQESCEFICLKTLDANGFSHENGYLKMDNYFTNTVLSGLMKFGSNK